MAIVVEQEKKRINLFAVLIVLTVVVLLGVAVYYIFFTDVPLIEKVLPTNLQVISTISSNNLKSSDLLNNPVYKNLKQSVSPVTEPVLQKHPNPWQPLQF